MVEQNFLQALGSGAKTYESTKPCVRHGVCVRYTKNKGCVQCAKDASAAQYTLTRGNLKRRVFWVHDDDMEVAELFINQLAEARKCRK